MINRSIHLEHSGRDAAEAFRTTGLVGGNKGSAMPEDYYHQKTDRNIGWVTRQEQELLRSKTVAIAGLGGVGGSHLLTLARLGIVNFTISDPDRFEPVNFNRQIGAQDHHVGKRKVDVLARMAHAVHEDVKINGEPVYVQRNGQRRFNRRSISSFARGIDARNVEQFLAGADIYVDALDFFAVAARRAVFATCHRLGIPAVTAAPLGMGVALLNFLPGHMSFDEYFGMEGQSEDEQLRRFYLGLAPAALQSSYLVDPSTINLQEHRGPSTPMGCELCAGVAGTQVLKILLGRGEVLAAPEGLQFDAYLNEFRRTHGPVKAAAASVPSAIVPAPTRHGRDFAA
jgi:molybdopterin/thiamine biosynthesis adenylyltransferase